MTVSWAKKEHHLLGYFPDSSWSNSDISLTMKDLQHACAIIKKSRDTRNELLVAHLNNALSVSSANSFIYFLDHSKQNIFQPLKVNEIAKWAMINANLLEPSSLGRPHFRAYLIHVVGINDKLIFGPRSGNGMALITMKKEIIFEPEDPIRYPSAKSIEALMHSYTLEKKKIFFDPLPIEEAIQLINKAGGRAVLAHPPTLGKDWYTFGPLLKNLVTRGLWGIEAFSPEISPEDHVLIHNLADLYSLNMTGGSDNHGTLKVYAKLGTVHKAGTDKYADLNDWARDGLQRSNDVHEL